MGCLGWMFVLGAGALFFGTFGLATPFAAPVLVIGLLFLLVSNTGKASKANRNLGDKVSALRSEIARLQTREAGRSDATGSGRAEQEPPTSKSRLATIVKAVIFIALLWWILFAVTKISRRETITIPINSR